MLKRFLKSEDGATAVECGLVAALIGVALITALALVGVSLDDIFTNVSADLSGAN
jgi:pilus assembly protein Flp/PilA